MKEITIGFKREDKKRENEVSILIESVRYIYTLQN